MKMLKLIWIQLKVNFNLSALIWYRRKERKKFWGILGMGVLVIASLAPLLLLYLRLMQDTYAAAESIEQAGVVIASTLVLTAVLVLFFSVIFVMSVFYFSRDIVMLISLPLLPYEILGAKFSVVLIYNYLITLPFCLPAVYLYGSNTGAGLFYWVSALIIFLFIPVIPLAFVSAFILLLMRFTNFSKNRDAMRMVGLIILLLVFISFSYYVTGIPAGQEAEFFESILMDEEGLISYTARVYPPALFATRALTAEAAKAALSLFYYLAMCFSGMLLMFFLGQRLYYEGFIGGSEVSKGKTLNQERLENKIGVSGSPVWAIARREIIYLIRTPIYLFNSLLLAAVLPLAFFVPVIAGGSMEQILDLLMVMDLRLLQILGVGGFMAVLTLFIPAASSSFSREGRMFWLSQVIPVPYHKQINGKILYSCLLSFTVIPVVAFIAVYFLPLNYGELVLAVLAGIVLSFPVITISLFIDLIRPYLNWDSPSKAIKQNINVLLSMIAVGVLYYLLYLAGRAAYFAFDAELPVCLVVLGGAALAGGISYIAMLKIAPEKYSSIRV